MGSTCWWTSFWNVLCFSYVLSPHSGASPPPFPSFPSLYHFFYLHPLHSPLNESGKVKQNSFSTNLLFLITIDGLHQTYPQICDCFKKADTILFSLVHWLLLAGNYFLFFKKKNKRVIHFFARCFSPSTICSKSKDCTSRAFRFLLAHLFLMKL